MSREPKAPPSFRDQSSHLADPALDADANMDGSAELTNDLNLRQRFLKGSSQSCFVINAMRHEIPPWKCAYRAGLRARSPYHRSLGSTRHLGRDPYVSRSFNLTNHHSRICCTMTFKSNQALLGSGPSKACAPRFHFITSSYYVP